MMFERSQQLPGAVSRFLEKPVVLEARHNDCLAAVASDRAHNIHSSRSHHEASEYRDDSSQSDEGREVATSVRHSSLLHGCTLGSGSEVAPEGTHDARVRGV